MISSRRDLIRFAGVAGASALLPQSLIANGDPREPGNRSAWRSRISDEVIDEVTATFATAMKTRSAEDFHAAATAGRILFRHLKETGYTDAHQRELFINGPAYPSSEWIDSLQSRFRDYGVIQSREELTALFTPSAEQLSAAAERIRTSTLHGVFMDAANAFERTASKLSGGRTSDLDIMDDTCRNLGIIIDGIAAVAALDGLGCLFGIVPACAIAGALAFVAAILMLAKDFICG